MITSEQLRGGRAMLRWSQQKLADTTGVSLSTVKRLEAGTGQVRGTYENVLAIQTALESAGIEFIPENGGGPGVRLRK